MRAALPVFKLSLLMSSSFSKKKAPGVILGLDLAETNIGGSLAVLAIEKYA